MERKEEQMKWFLTVGAVFLSALLLIAAYKGEVVEPSPRVQGDVIVLHPELPNDGVLTLLAGDLGIYKIDTRFDMCFLMTVHNTVKVPCKPFDKYFEHIEPRGVR